MIWSYHMLWHSGTRAPPLLVRKQEWWSETAWAQYWLTRGEQQVSHQRWIWGKDASKWGINPGFEAQGRYHPKFETWVSMTPSRGSSGGRVGGGGARNMKYMRPVLVAIFFMTNFYRAGVGTLAPPPPDPLLGPTKRTDVLHKFLEKYLLYWWDL